MAAGVRELAVLSVVSCAARHAKLQHHRAAESRNRLELLLVAVLQEAGVLGDDGGSAQRRIGWRVQV